MSETHWMDDPEVMGHLDDWLSLQQEPLSRFMQTIMQYSDETPIWAILVVYGKFVMHYNMLRSEGTQLESFNEALARIANDPLVMQLVGQMMGGMVGQAAGLDD